MQEKVATYHTLATNLLFTKFTCAKIVIPRIHFAGQSFIAGSRAQILVSKQQKEKAKWRTRVHQIRVVNPKNLHLKPPIRPLQSCKRRYQMLLIYLITSLTRLSMLGTKLCVFSSLKVLMIQS